MSLKSSLGGIREALNRRPAIGVGLGGLVLVVAAVVIVAQARGCRGTAGGGGDLAKAYFATDDGKTLIVDDATKVPPFDQNGQTYYRAVTYRCKKTADNPVVVTHLEKYPPDVKQQMEQARSADVMATLTAFQRFSHLKQVKRPGEKEWVSLSDKPAERQKYQEVMAPPKLADCPPEDLEVVLP